MKDKKQLQSDNFLEKAIDALRQSSVPAEVSGEVVKAALAVGVGREDFKPTISRIERIKAMKHISKIAAVLIIFVGIIGFMAVFTPGNGSSGMAWADVIEPIMNARNAIMDTIIGDEENSPVIHDMIIGSRIRRSMSNLEDISIIDLETMKVLSLDPENKKATYIDMKGLPPIPNQLEMLRNLIVELEKKPEFEIEELGEQEIDGQIVVGFRASCPKAQIIIWADPETGLPVRMEVDANQMLIICKNFQFDVEMDESLFSMEVPQGYTTQKIELDLFGSTEEDFIEGLRVQAEVFYDGRFPDSVAIEDYVKQAPMLKEKFDALNLSDEEELELGMKLQKHVLFLRFFKGDGKWHYAGKGVELGDGDRAIFWYRPANSESYRVIYGDLSVEDVLPGDLPEEPETQAVAERPKLSSNYVVSEEDEWMVISVDQINASSQLVFKKLPDAYEHLVVRLPFDAATIEAVKYGDEDVSFFQTGNGEYEVDLASHWSQLSNGSITILWTFSPATCLTPSEEGRYWTPLKSLVLSDFFSLTVTIAEGNGFFGFSVGDREVRTIRGFSASSDKPKMDYGKWGGLVKK